MTQSPQPTAAAPVRDVTELLSTSRPRSSFRYARRVFFGVWALVVAGAMLKLSEAAQAGLVAVALFVTIGGIAVVWTIAQAYQSEKSELDQLEDAVALKHLAVALPRLQHLMSKPMRSADHRVRAMLLLASTLARLNHPQDALAVYDELIDREGLAGPGGAMVKVGRALVMLRTDHLYDADRAINDLRRLIDRGGIGIEMRAIDETLPVPPDDVMARGALRLLELYRDLKTGHLQEAVEAFEHNLPFMRQGLGHRVAEAHALAALALDGLGREIEARQCFTDATALQPLIELVRRYPELRPLTTKYTQTPAPPL